MSDSSAKPTFIKIGVILLVVVITLPLLARLRPIDRGSWTDNRYYNRYLHLSMVSPSGWSPLTTKEMVQGARDGAEEMFSDSSEYEISDNRRSMLLTHLRSPVLPGDYEPRLILSVKKIGYPGGTPSPQWHIDEFIKLSQGSKFTLDVLENNVERTVGGQSALYARFKVARVHPSTGEVFPPLLGELFAFKRRAYSVLIMIGYTREEEKQALYECLGSIQLP